METEFPTLKQQDAIRRINGYGVPFHQFEITLSDGCKFFVDSGEKATWEAIHPMRFEIKGLNDTEVRVCWGDEIIGWNQIVVVVDTETGKQLDPLWWADCHIWKYDEAYSS